MTRAVTFPVEVEWHGHELTLIIHATVTPPVPGCLYGAPEDCYPDEPGEMEIDRVELEEGYPAAFEEELFEMAQQAATDAVESAREAAADLKVDHAQEDTP